MATDRTCLLIEDDAATRRQLRAALEHEGWRVVEAPDGASALAAVEARPPDLVVQDLAVPDMEGSELKRRLAERCGPREVPVVATSGFLSTQEQGQALALGFADHLFKPVDPDRLVEVAQSLVTRRIGAGPGRGRRVLVVDDDPVQRRLLELQLRQAGFVVRAAPGAQEALALVAAERPDAVVSDVLMGGLDGFQLCLRLRTDPTLAGLPVVLVSVAFTEEADAELSRRIGASALVARTPDHARVIEALALALRDGPPPVDARTTLDDDDHAQRMIRRLERQAGQNAELSGRLALHEAAMGVLVRLGETARAQASLTQLLPDLLHHALDAAGIKSGAVFLLEAGDPGQPEALALRAEHGFPGAARSVVAGFFGRADLLALAGESHDPVRVPALAVEAAWETELLQAAGARSLHLLPLRQGQERLGVLVLATTTRRLAGEWLPFAEAVGAHIAQAVALARAVRQLASEKEQLRVSEARLRAITDNMLEVFWSAGGRLERIDYVSARYEEVWGRPRQALYDDPRAWMDAIHPDDRQAAMTRILAAVDVQAQFEVRYRILRPDGGLRWVQVRGFPVKDGAASGTSYVGTAMDVTDLERSREREAALEAQLRRSQKMEAVGRLAGGVSHDFNNLLTGILGYSELLLDKLDPRDPLRAQVEEIRKAGERAASLTRQLLVFSRHETITPQLLDPCAVVTEMGSLVRRLIGEDLELVVELAPDAGQVLLDKGYLEQVLLNLCVNARDAMPTGGRLSVRVARAAELRVGSEARGPEVVLTVADTGSGMTPEVLSHLFEPFFTTKAAGKGTGLGLSTVYGIVDGAGGHIEVTSDPGRGSSFAVHLPRVDEAPTLRAPATPAPAAGRGAGTVLLVEDDDVVRGLARAILEQNGYGVLEASTGDAALRLTEGGARFDLLLTDVVMPGLSGPELATRLVAARPGLTVVYMSGYTSGELRHAEAASSGAAFIQKPFTPRSLAHTVREALER